jgi:hypothetical protein
MNLKTLQQTRVARNTPSLSCVWIATGNPRRPLECVWIDSNATVALGATGTEGDAVSVGEDHLGVLAA